MQETRKKILIIDDDHFAQKLVECTLSEIYDIRVADNGDQGLIIAVEWMPDCILLDVEMPEKNGYDVCKIIRLTPEIAKIPVIFLSANSSLQEKILGFEAGADSYLVKPFEAEFLRAKVATIVGRYLEHQELNKTAKEAQGMAFEALTGSAELGRALRFVEHTYALDNLDALAQAVFKVMSEFDLITSLSFSSIHHTHYYSSNSVEISPLEKDLLHLLRDQGRFVDFGCRTFVNYHCVSLLIKNMPLDNMERYGRIKDTVPFILGAVDGKVRSLDLQHSLMNQANSMSKSVDAIGKTLKHLTEEVSKGQDKVSDIVRYLLSDLEFRLPRLGLEQDQERYIVEKITAAFDETLAQMQHGSQVNESLHGIVRLLEHLSAQQRKLLENSFVAQQASKQTNLPNDGDVYSNDVELF